MEEIRDFLANTIELKKLLQMYPLLRSEAGSHSGDNGDEVPPVPIPNTEVKLVRGESTWHRAPGRITRCRIST